jgi:DNA-binding response OmpR family regulator
MAKKKTILLVEDDEGFRKVFEEALTNAGFSVSVAGDGDAGLQKALANTPDLILLDMMMPKMTGLVMLDKFKKDHKGEMPKVLLLTNVEDQEHVSSAAHVGVYDYLIKSKWSVDEIVEKVRAKLFN